MQERFVAVCGADPNANALFERLARCAHDHGARVVESFWAPEARRVYTLVQAPSPEAVREICQEAGVRVGSIARAMRVYPDLLDEPMRSR